MISKICGIILGIIMSYLFFNILNNRCSIIIGDGIIQKFNNKCITYNNRCSHNK
jgi:hypothetical protein